MYVSRSSDSFMSYCENMTCDLSLYKLLSVLDGSNTLCDLPTLLYNYGERHTIGDSQIIIKRAGLITSIINMGILVQTVYLGLRDG